MGRKHAVAVTRLVKETGRGTIEVPDGEDPYEYLEKLRESGDDFLEWNSDDVSDIQVSVEPVDADA